jgi:hypothetical protein
MSSHEKIIVDPDQPYEENIIGLKGIIYFMVGLFLLIVVTFGLMWIFQYQVLQPQAEAMNEKNKNPMALSDKERLPPEPRLQSAPGFGVDDPKNNRRVSLELREPQAEYRELEKQWKDLWENGQKNGDTVISLPIEEAKEKMLADKNIKAVSAEEGKKVLEEVNSRVSSSSAGRKASERIR